VLKNLAHLNAIQFDVVFDDQKAPLWSSLSEMLKLKQLLNYQTNTKNNTFFEFSCNFGIIFV
jgi:hypothetical protein